MRDPYFTGETYRAARRQILVDWGLIFTCTVTATLLAAWFASVL